MLLSSCASLAPPESDSLFAPGKWEGSPVVTTIYGTLEGSADKNDTFAWLGIPYAAPPVGDLRWQAPRPPEAWEGIRRASRFGSQSAQRSFVTGAPVGSEDSLYLNVWRPATERRGLPVYVWIHGGANTSGASNASPEYMGYPLAAKADLVFVSVNYRLDVFGWFDHPALKTGDPDTDSGNFGTLDLIAALEWIRDNIEAFGGDPDNVTIAGESAGAFNVLTLLIAPKAKGLFHKAVVESGYTRGPKVEAGDYARALARKLAIRRGKAKNDEEAESFLASMGKGETAKWLKGASAGELLRLSKSPDKEVLSIPCPIFDGAVLPADGFAALADPERRADVPLIIGTNKEETKLFLLLLNMSHRDPLYRDVAEVTSALWKAEGADSIADAFSAGAAGRKTYLYRFDWGAPDENGKSVMGGWAGAKLGAAHGMEIPFFLQTDMLYDTIFPLRIFTKVNEKGRHELQSKIGGYLAAFVRTGDPNGSPGDMQEELLFWEPWDTRCDRPAFIIFDADYKNARIRLERGRTTKDSVAQSIEREAPEALKEKLLKVSPMFP